jgi:hypothetical protein
VPVRAGWLEQQAPQPARQAQPQEQHEPQAQQQARQQAPQRHGHTVCTRWRPSRRTKTCRQVVQKAQLVDHLRDNRHGWQLHQL